MGKIMGVFFLLFVAAAIGAASLFGWVSVAQGIYIIKMAAGWAAWVCFVAILYAGLEKLFPGVLCDQHTDT
ncbi:MAG: hypothetical protein QOG83_480 [Alphaproteobacteria bacterium]|jgi:hypothetical protein|nr:hypothetical protein [Alphaproteobacteria bacterium]